MAVQPFDRKFIRAGLRRRMAAGLLIVALALSAACTRDGSGGDTPTPTPPGGTPDVRATVEPSETFQGEGNDATDVFEVGANWELRYELTSGRSLAIELLTDKGESRGEIVRTTKAKPGSTFISEAGNYKLKVASEGKWTLSVLNRSDK